MALVGPDGGPWAGKVFRGPSHGFRDAWLIKRILEKTSRIAHVPHVMYYHNIPYSDKVRATSWGRPVKGVGYQDWVNITNRSLETANAGI